MKLQILYKKLFLLWFLVFVSFHLFAQDYENFYSQSLTNNKNGMYVLGTWAIGNMITGGIGWSQASGNTKYFHQMNLFWNSVNLALAGIGYFNAINTDISMLSNADMLSNHNRFETILLINAGLDIGYMGLGYYLHQQAKLKDKNKHLLKGYGNSIMLQGAFLFVFDVALFMVQRNHRFEFLEHSNLNISLAANQMSILYTF